MKRPSAQLLKFLAVGGACWILTAAINYLLKLTVLAHKPVIALTIANVVATFVSYALNRSWTFRTRGGRRRHHELLLYLLINGIGIGLNALPLFLARNVFHLRVPNVSITVQEFSDFAWGMVVGTLLATAFRMWSYRRWVFPHENAHPTAADADAAAAVPDPPDRSRLATLGSRDPLG
jgi:putative flippase GtrA